jgi:tetratricopeptide (TPR) repeat protein
VASVIGRLFWDAAVEIICRQHGSQIDESLWPALRQREIVYLREGTAFEGTTEYVFKHALLRDVTYESVLRRLRREYHRHAAEWLIKVGGDRVDEFADQIANHFATAGADSEEAEWQARTGRQAARQYAAPEAIRALSRALELTPAEDLDRRFDLLDQRRQVYHLLGDRTAEAADLAEQARLAAAMEDQRCLAQVAVDQVRFQLVIGAYEEALTLSARAHTLAQASTDSTLMARALAGRGNSLMFLGEYDEARAALESGLEVARSAGAKSVLMDITRILGVVAEEQGDFDAQRRFYEESLGLARELGDRVGVRRALNSLGIVALNRGAHAEARDYYEQSLAIARAIGDRMGEGTVLGNLGVRASNLGEYEQARQLFEEALTIARDANDRTGVNVNVLNLAGILAHLGETDAAVARYEEALSGARETGDRPLIGYILNGKGRVLLEGGRLVEAIEVLRHALDLRLELGQNHLATETRAYLSEALAINGDLAAALVEGESALSFLEDGQLEDAEDESRVFLSLYRLLRTIGDERAGALLERAYTRLQAAADVLDAPSRQAYLNNVPWNRAILTLWEERGD